MKKYCESYYTTRVYGLGFILRFECTKRAGHYGRHCDAYGGTWKKESNKR